MLFDLQLSAHDLSRLDGRLSVSLGAFRLVVNMSLLCGDETPVS